VLFGWRGACGYRDVDMKSIEIWFSEFTQGANTGDVLFTTIHFTMLVCWVLNKGLYKAQIRIKNNDLSYDVVRVTCFGKVTKIHLDLKGTKICWHSWHPTPLDKVTARSSGKRFSRLCSTVAPLSHDVHSFTRKAFTSCQCIGKQILISQCH
jgi:hypothetical protein